MAVSIDDVRVTLNNIPDEVLSDATIQMKIQEAFFDFNRVKVGTITTEQEDITVRAVAAYKAASVANVFDSIRIDVIAVSKDYEDWLDRLKKEAMKRLAEVAGGKVDVNGNFQAVIVTKADHYDERPEDPFSDTLLI